jgi:hypothetical protein
MVDNEKAIRIEIFPAIFSTCCTLGSRVVLIAFHARGTSRGSSAGNRPSRHRSFSRRISRNLIATGRRPTSDISLPAYGTISAHRHPESPSHLALVSRIGGRSRPASATVERPYLEECCTCLCVPSRESGRLRTTVQ